MGYLSDPGAYVINARNKIVFDKWEMDQWNIMHISPLPHYITYLLFAVLGVGILQMNLVPAIFSILILITSYSLFKKYLPAAFSLLGIFLLGINFQFTMFSRIAVRVMPMLFFTILALLFLEKGKRRTAALFWAGTACFVAFTVKGTFLQIFPSILLGWGLYTLLQNQKKFKALLPPVLYFLLGIAAMGLIWLVGFYLPHKEMFASYGSENIHWLSPRGFREIFVNFWKRPLFFFNEMPIIASLSSLCLLGVFFKATSSPRKVSVLEWICGFWVISNMLYYSVIYYHAARHFVVLIFPMVFLAVLFLKNLSEAKTFQRPLNPLLFYPFLFIWLLFPLSSLVIIRSRPITIPEMQSKSLIALILSLGITVATFLVIHLWPKRRKIIIPRIASLSLIAFLVCGCTILHMKPYLKWALSPQYNVKIISQDLGKAFDHMVIAGLITPLVSLENTHEVHPYYRGYINPFPNFLEKFKVTHILPTVHAGAIEKKHYQMSFPKTMQNARLIARYPLGRTYAELYDIRPSRAIQKKGNVYEGETFFGDRGIPRFDQDASGQLSYLMPKSKQGMVLHCPTEEEYTPGQYQATFFLKKDLPLETRARVARIDIMQQGRKNPLASLTISNKDGLSGQTYEPIVLSFNLKKPASLMLRVYSTGKTPLWLDRVVIRKENDRPLSLSRSGSSTSSSSSF